MISQMTMGKKLMLAMGAMVALTLGLAWSGLSPIGTLGRELDFTATVSARKSELVGEINLEFANMSRAQRGLALYSILKDPAKAEQVGRPFHTSADQVERYLAELRSKLQTERGKQLVEHLSTSLSAWRPLHDDLHRLCETQRFDHELTETLDKMISYGNEAMSATNELVQLQRELFASAAQQASEETSRSRWIAVVFVGLCLVAGGETPVAVGKPDRLEIPLEGDFKEF